MSIDDRDIAFNTGLNYLKRHLTGSATLTLSGSYDLQSTTITHNLTYIPAVRVFHEYNGLLFEAGGQAQGVPPAAGNSYSQYRINTTELVILAGNGPGSSMTVKVHYIIYLDSAV